MFTMPCSGAGVCDATRRTTAERLQIQIIRILYGCRVGGDYGYPGLRFAYPGL